jgi:hypothetical protein
MKFIVEIELGNAQMQKGEDIAEALIRVGKGLNPEFLADQPTGKRKILDLNGNVVGYYQVTEIGFPDQNSHLIIPNDYKERAKKYE